MKFAKQYSEASPHYRGPWGIGMGPLPGDSLTCVIETRRFSFREYLSTLLYSRASLLLVMAVRAHGEWRGIYIPKAIACHSFSFSYPLYILSPAWFSDLLTAFSWLLQPSRRERGLGESTFLVRGPLHCLDLSFVSPPLAFSRLKICVLPLCMRLEFLLPPPSTFTAFHCFCVFVYCWIWAQWARTAVKRAAHHRCDFQNFCMRTLSSFPSLMSQSLHCWRGKRKRSSKSRERQSTSSYWLSHASTEQHAIPECFSRGRCCPVPAPVTLGHWCTCTSGCGTHARSLRERTQLGIRHPASWRSNFLSSLQLSGSCVYLIVTLHLTLFCKNQKAWVLVAALLLVPLDEHWTMLGL